MISERYRNSQLLGILLALCLLDLLLTSAELNLGLIIEVNPIMRYLADVGLYQFMLGKVVLTLVCCLVFYKTIEHRLTSFGVRLATRAYGVVAIFHILGIINELA